MKISIVTLSFNQCTYLKEAMDSVLSQRYPDLEYIVVDPGSTDGSRELIQSYADRISRIVFEPDRGAADGLRKGFELATGDVYGFLNADDLLFPGSLARVAEFFEAHPECQMAMGDGFTIDGSGKTIRHYRARNFTTLHYFYGGARWLQQSTFFCAEAYRRSPKFNVENRTCWDGELFVNLVNQGARIGYIRADLGGFRIYDGSISGSGRLHKQFEKDSQRIFHELTGHPWRTTDRLLCYLYRTTGLLTVVGSRLLIPRKSRPHMKIAFLWTALSGYMNACLKELSGRDGVELFVCHQSPGEEAPYEDGQFAWIRNKIVWRDRVNRGQLEKKLREFKPDVMVIPSWHVTEYRVIAKRFAQQTWRVMVMDNPWRGSLKQKLGALVAPLYVRPIADVVWLPGERQATFAKKLGFSQRTILRGSFTCDQPAFSAIHEARLAQKLPMPRNFIFIGRMVRAKSVDVLAESYRAYRRRCANPWPLICCGSGPLRPRLENQEGVEVAGFVQPEEMPRVLASVGCLILPSTFEPWALVIHEAASAGRIVLASENVGAVAHLVQPGYNGFIFKDKDVEGLTALMLRVSAMTDEQLNQMSCASHQLSGQFSPHQWADILLQSYQSRSLTM